MFERIVAFWKGNDIVHLFGGFLRFGAQDKGPDQQHRQQPRREPGESSHTSWSWEPRPVKIWMVSSMAATKKPPAHTWKKGCSFTVRAVASKPQDSPPAANSVKWAIFRTMCTSCSWLGNMSRMNPGQNAQHPPTLRSWESERLTREFPPDKGQVAHQQKA